jgi:excisionase family DNA binding protein
LARKGVNSSRATNTRPTRAVILTREVAERLGCSPKTVRELVATGRLNPVRLSPRGHLRFRLEEIENLIAGEKPDE